MTVVQIMLYALRAQACGADSADLSNISEADIRSLYVLSNYHDMAHIVSAELEKQGLLNDALEETEKFKEQQILAVFRYENLKYELEQVCKTLENAQISFIPLKGSVIRDYYPQPWMRTSCDIDVLVKKEDLERAVEAIKIELKYEIENRGLHDVSLFSESGFHLELHYDLVEEGRAKDSAKILSKCWDYATPCNGYSYQFRFTDEMFYFYHIAHMAKHIEGGGCGVRPFLDLWILDKRVENDGSSRDALLCEGGLLEFAEVARRLSSVWFGKAEHSELTEQLERYVFLSGAYGSLENRIALKQTKEGGKRYLLRRIFVPYDTIKEYYPILKKHRWLTPLMEIRRWFSLAFGGGFGRLAEEVKLNMTISEEQQSQTSELLHCIGLGNENKK